MSSGIQLILIAALKTTHFPEVTDCQCIGKNEVTLGTLSTPVVVVENPSRSLGGTGSNGLEATYPPVFHNGLAEIPGSRFT
jgi:hypothetical protein